MVSITISVPSYVQTIATWGVIPALVSLVAGFAGLIVFFMNYSRLNNFWNRYLGIVHGKKTAKREVSTSLAIWLLALIPACLPLVDVLGSYRFNTTWCWIGPATPQRLLALYAWVWVFFSLALAAAIGLCRHLSLRLRFAQGRLRTNRTKILFRLALYPVAYVLVWVPATVARAENLLNPSFEGINTKVLFSVVDFCLQMSGFLNFCIFIYSNYTKLRSPVADRQMVPSERSESSGGAAFSTLPGNESELVAVHSDTPRDASPVQATGDHPDQRGYKSTTNPLAGHTVAGGGV